MNSLVSILIPAYNASRWLNESVGSALAQTWPNKEVIIVDDGSKDDTLTLARRFEASNVRVVTQDNMGAPGARNHALRLAQGDYIQWLDADDVLHPEKIARQLAHAGPGRTSRTLLTSAWGKFFFRTRKAQFKPDALWTDHSGLSWIMARFDHNVWMNPGGWLVPRKLTDMAGPWDTRLASSGDDDGEYVCRLAACADQVKFVRDAICYYRIGTVGSLNWSMETSEKALESLLLSLRLTTQALLTLENSERTRRSALAHLQTFSSYFYASESGFHERLRALAAELNGSLDPPKLSWKYYPLELVFGPKATKTIMRNWRASKLIARRNLDSYLHRVGI